MCIPFCSWDLADDDADKAYGPPQKCQLGTRIQVFLLRFIVYGGAKT